MAPQSDQPLLQSQQEEEQQKQFKLQNVRQGFKIPNFKQQKSFEILKSAVKNLTSNTKLMFLMTLSILPFLAFIVLFEINIHEIEDVISKLLVPPSISSYIDLDKNILVSNDENDPRRRVFLVVLEFVPFHLTLLPLLELFSLTIIINISAKIYAGNMESSTVKDTFYHKNKFKGPFITSLWVQLFSTSTLFGLVWAVANHKLITDEFFLSDYLYGFTYSNDFALLKGFYVDILSIGFHGMIFLVLFYKYLDWSALWNMGMVISVLEGDIGLDALEMSAYYRKHSKRTGFQLMLVFFAYSVILRLPFLLATMCNYVTVRVVVTAIVVVLVCLGSLVKWVAFVLYFYHCKAQVLLKKVDEEVDKPMNAGDAC